MSSDYLLLFVRGIIPIKILQRRKVMNILVIGNGFDLAHGLPTRYADFLRFCKESKKLLNIENHYNYGGMRYTNVNIHPSIVSKLTAIHEYMYCDNNLISSTEKPNDLDYVENIISYIDNNSWYTHFSIQFENSPLGNNWIDFESEIKRIVEILDKENITKHKTYGDIETTAIFNRHSIYFSKYDRAITPQDFLNALAHDLNRFICAFEIYLRHFVEGSNIAPINDIKALHIDRVLSFNYTHTFEKIYTIKPDESASLMGENTISYIHGETQESTDINSNKMVLGIDEYLPEEEKDKNLSFIDYKKYFQRIYKETGNEYLQWENKIESDSAFINKPENSDKKEKIIDDISQNKCRENSLTSMNTHQLYIFGHSLNVADGDVFRRLILHDNVKTNIFYHRKKENDKRDLKQKITNLVKIIGQDELIKRTGGSTRTIEFVPQSIPES